MWCFPFCLFVANWSWIRLLSDEKDFLNAFWGNWKAVQMFLPLTWLLSFIFMRCLQKIIVLFGNEGSLLMFANKAGSTLGSPEATLETDDGASWGLNCCLPLVLVVPPPYTVTTSFYWWLVTSPKYSQVVLPIFEEFQVVPSSPKWSQVVPSGPN